MTEPSSAGNPDGAALPSDHPLGPAVPVPPRDKERGTEAVHAGREATPDGGTTADDAPGADGHPGGDRRENILDPSAGSAGHPAAGIREEQGTHEAGAVPAAFDGDGARDPEHRRPEDAADQPEAWDAGGAPQ